MRRRILPLIFILIFAFFLISPGSAQYSPSGNTQPDIESQLEAQDQQILADCQYRYQVDYRYNDVLGKMYQAFNQHLAEVYPNPNLDVNYYVFASQMGFNAMTFHRIVIMDSLLLDTLRFLSEGIIVYGGTDNEYVHSLAKTINQLNVAHQNGQIYIDYSNLDNPFGLPRVNSITTVQQTQAMQLFESMLASWIAHEGSHAFLDHIKKRAEITHEMMQQNDGSMTQEQLQAYIQQYIATSIGVKMETEADTYATKLLVKSGYPVKGFIYWLEFGDYLEELSGQKYAYFRTHPPCPERITNIKKVAKSMGGSY